MKGDGFAILVGDRYREAEADDQKIDLRAGGGERRDPAALARPLETEARSASARHPARFGERGDGIVGEQRKDLRIFVARCAGARSADHKSERQSLMRISYD